MRIILRRKDLERVGEAGPWKMVYGRRKTGKTFLVENFFHFDKFFFVNRDATLLDKGNGEKYTYFEFSKLFKEIVGEKNIVLDEFHRLPEEFLDYLHSLGIKGKLTLITSTLWLAKELLGRGSPLLGLVYPVRIGLIDERDILLELSKEFRGKEFIEACVYLREPFLIPSFTPSSRKFVSNFLYEGKFFMRGLIGEIFREEEKELTNVYEGVLSAVAAGKSVSTEISTTLFSRNLIVKDNPGIVQKYLSTLVQLGLLERLKVFGKKRFRYFHSSPLIDLHYYLDEKYSYTEIEVPKKFVRKVVETKMPLHVEQFFRAMLSKEFGMSCQLIEEKDLQVDIALFEFKKPAVVAEVKWKQRLYKKEIRKIEDKLGGFAKCRKILIVPNKKCLETEPADIEVWDIKKIIEIAKNSSKKTKGKNQVLKR